MLEEGQAQGAVGTVVIRIEFDLAVEGLLGKIELAQNSVDYAQLQPGVAVPGLEFHHAFKQRHRHFIALRLHGRAAGVFEVICLCGFWYRWSCAAGGRALQRDFLLAVRFYRPAKGQIIPRAGRWQLAHFDGNFALSRRRLALNLVAGVIFAVVAEQIYRHH